MEEVLNDLNEKQRAVKEWEGRHRKKSKEEKRRYFRCGKVTKEQTMNKTLEEKKNGIKRWKLNL